MKNWVKWILATVILAAVIHLVTVIAIPYGIMLSLKLKSDKANRKVNTLFHAPRVTAESRRVVRPSPDLLYSACGYDVSKEALRFTVPIPDTYWSLSFFASNTDNFFVVNDRDVKSKHIKILLVGSNTSYPDPGDAQVVVSPTNKGVAIFRILITDEDRLNHLIQVQKQATCRAEQYKRNTD